MDTEQSRIENPIAGKESEFGSSIAADGERIVVGGRAAVSEGQPNSSGAAWVYVRRGRDWVAEGVLAPPKGTLNGSYFGLSAAFSGQLIAVGAPREGEFGSVYIFRRQEGAWAPTAVIRPPERDRTPGEHFGWAVALHGSTLVVGAPLRKGRDGKNSGAAFAYPVDAKGKAGEAAQLDAALSPNAHLGWAVAVQGDVVAVGGPTDVDPHSVHKLETGAVRLFAPADGGWQPGHVLRPEKEAVAVERFGAALAIDAGAFVVGAPHAPRKRNDGGDLTGAAYVFDLGGEGPKELARLTPRPGHAGSFGHAVAVNAAHVLVGAPGANARVGQGRLFAWTAEGRLVPVSNYDAPDVPENAGFGGAVALGAGAARGAGEALVGASSGPAKRNFGVVLGFAAPNVVSGVAPVEADTVLRARTDGFVVAVASAGNDSHGYVTGWAGAQRADVAAKAGSAVRSIFALQLTNEGGGGQARRNQPPFIDQGSFAMPVQRGEFFRVAAQGIGGGVTIQQLYGVFQG